MNTHKHSGTTLFAADKEALYIDAHEQQRHENNICAMADEIGRPAQEIAELYEDVLRQLKTQARISDYLPILVSKRIKQICRRR